MSVLEWEAFRIRKSVFVRHLSNLPWPINPQKIANIKLGFDIKTRKCPLNFENWFLFLKCSSSTIMEVVNIIHSSKLKKGQYSKIWATWFVSILPFPSSFPNRVFYSSDISALGLNYFLKLIKSQPFFEHFPSQVKEEGKEEGGGDNGGEGDGGGGWAVVRERWVPAFLKTQSLGQALDKNSMFITIIITLTITITWIDSSLDFQ